MGRFPKVNPFQTIGMSQPSAGRTFQSKEEIVAEYLREGILSGRIARGTHLKQIDVAGELAISITPVRAAFRLLEAEGYLLSETHRGVVVAPFDMQASGELMELRILLEGRLVRKAMEALDAKLHRELLAIEREFEAAIEHHDRATVRAMNYRFHSFLYGAAAQPQTLHFMQVLWAKYPFDLINVISGRPGRAAREHRAIMKAVLARDEPAALAAVRQHIQSGWEELMNHLKQAEAQASPKRRVGT